MSRSMPKLAAFAAALALALAACGTTAVQAKKPPASRGAAPATPAAPASILPYRKTELPMDKYRIPCLIFSDGFVQPQEFNKTMSQMDVMPTLFGLLNFNYQSKFLGQDVFEKNYQPRAYIATYQDLGLIKDNTLTVLSPNQKVKQYQLKLKPSNLPDNFKLYYDEILLKNPNQKLVDESIATYQSASYWLKENKLNK